jgi:hypothetical protein
MSRIGSVRLASASLLAILGIILVTLTTKDAPIFWLPSVAAFAGALSLALTGRSGQDR